MVKMIHRPRQLESLKMKRKTDAYGNEIANKVEEDNEYHLRGRFMDIKPNHPSEPPKFTMRLLREQFEE